jgi:hypothetical protein
MKITTANLMMAFATIMLISSVAGHEMFEHKKFAKVQGTEVPWTSWFTDQFCMIVWIISAIVVYPIGAISALFGFPTLYTDMYHGVVAGIFKLTLSGY